MKYEWDEDKRLSNIAKHNIDFVDVVWFDWETAKISEDKRKSYGETRFICYGLIHGRLMVLCFTMRADNMRIISLRKANQREVEYYGN